MQEPTWREVLDYAITAFQREDWPYENYVAIGLLCVAMGLLIGVARVLVSRGWARHRQQQQLSIVRYRLVRWTESLGQPFWTLSTTSQLEAIGRLREVLVGDVEMVIALLLALRLQLEAHALDDQVLQAVDRLTAEWEDKTVAAHRRRYRKLRGLVLDREELLERRRETSSLDLPSRPEADADDGRLPGSLATNEKKRGYQTGAGVRHGLGEWFKAVLAALTLGAVVGSGCACVAILFADVAAVGLEALFIPSCAVASFAGIATAAHFLWLFSRGELEAHDIWKSIGKFLTALSKETPP